MKELFYKIEDFWDGLDLNKKVIVFGGLLLSLLLICLLILNLVTGEKHNNNIGDNITTEEVTTVEEYGEIRFDENNQPITDGKPKYKTMGDIEDSDYAPTKKGIINWDIPDGIYILSSYDSKYSDMEANMNFYGSADLRLETVGVKSDAKAILYKDGEYKEVDSLDVDVLSKEWNEFNK